MRKWLIIVCLGSSIQSFGQVNLQTGAANIDLPLFQYADTKSRLGTNISLNYITGNGVKVNEVASNVGTGWAIQASGVITRIQHGEPDDQFFVDLVGGPHTFREQTVFGTHIDDYYPDGYMYSTISPSSPVPAEGCYSPVFTNTSPFVYKPNYDDREQDAYSFEFNGRSGQFVIGKNKVPEILDDSKLVITFQEEDMTAQKIRTRISTFTIIDEEGIKYKFTEQEVIDVLKFPTSGLLINNIPVFKGIELSPSAIRKVITKWFLTEIINPATNEKIIFNYDTYSIDFEGTKHISKQQTVTSAGTQASTQVMVERTKISTKRLASFTTPDYYTVNFGYSVNDRADLPGDKALTSINVLYNNNLLYGYQFNYSYFFKTELKPYTFSFQQADKRYSRLCLTDFKKVGSDGSSLPPYKLNYYLPGGGLDIFPPMYSLYSDHWGYYNIGTVTLAEDADGNLTSFSAGSFGPKSFGGNVGTINGIIKNVEYPEGGSLEFEYELNTAENSPYANKEAGGMRVKRTVLYDGVSHTNDIAQQYKYINLDGTSSAWGFESAKYTETSLTRQYKISGNVHAGSNAKEFATNLIKSSIIDGMTQMSCRFMAGSFLYSTPVANAAYQVIVYLIIAKIIEELFSDPYKDFNVTVYKSDNLNLSNPLPLQYKRVEVIVEANNGKTVHEFTDDQYYALRVPGPIAIPYSTAKQRFASWVYGLPRFTTWFNSLNQPVRKIENEYNPIVREINNANFLSKSWYPNTNVGAEAFLNNSALFNTSYITSETFYPLQGRMELTKTIETIYNNAGQSTTTETSYTYNPINFLVQTVSRKDSKGDFTGATTYYTCDYNISGIINDLKAVNRIDIPVSINTWIKGAQATSRQLINSTVTEFSAISTGDIKPFQIHQSELAAPLSNTIADAVNFSTTNYKGYSYLKPQVAMIYSLGNIGQNTIVPGNSNKSIIYDYNQRLAVAEITNAALNEIQYTSFESDGTGGWLFNPNGIITTYCPTGKKCFDLSKGNVTSGPVSRLRPVIISLWTTGSQVQYNCTIPPVTNQYAPTRTGPTINGWTYCEFEVPDISLTTSLTISGNGLIDELRYYPQNARMATCTYDPGVGKTAECDINNRIIYYEYDGLGRIIKMRDQNRNLLKAYEYNYKQ